MSNFQGYPQDNHYSPYGQNPNVGGTYPYPPQGPQQPTFPTAPVTPPVVFTEQSYIENILRLNRGKIATIYMNFENSEWGSQIFQGIVEAAGKDHIIISDPNTGVRYILLMIYLNYITFDEEINYEYPFAAQPTTQFSQAPIFNMPNQAFGNQPQPFRKNDSKDES